MGRIRSPTAAGSRHRDQRAISDMTASRVRRALQQRSHASWKPEGRSGVSPADEEIELYRSGHRYAEMRRAASSLRVARRGLSRLLCPIHSGVLNGIRAFRHADSCDHARRSMLWPSRILRRCATLTFNLPPRTPGVRYPFARMEYWQATTRDLTRPRGRCAAGSSSVTHRGAPLRVRATFGVEIAALWARERVSRPVVRCHIVRYRTRIDSGLEEMQIDLPSRRAH